MSRVAFMGSKALGLTVLRQIASTVKAPHQIVGVVCPDDVADSRTELELFRALTGAKGIPIEIVDTIRQTEAVLRSWQPNVVIVCGWYQLIQLKNFPESNFFGFHASLLPRYRGNAPLVWQIIAGEAEVGISFFQFAPNLDEGDIVAQSRLPLGQDETIKDALERVAACAVEQTREYLPGLLDGTALLQRQDHTQATYCALRVPEDGLIDWSWPAQRVHNFVRAQTRPYPGAFIYLADGRRVRIWRTAVDPRSYVGVPGGIAERTEGAVVVTCGEGAVRVVEAEVDADPGVPLHAILNSLRLRLR